MTTEQKLKKIEDTVMADAGRTAQALCDHASSRRDEELAAIRDKTAEEERLRYQKETAEIEAKLSRDLSRIMLESKRQIISERDRLADDIFSQISQKLVGYTDTEDYKLMLSRLIDTHIRTLTAGRSVMLVRKQDSEMIEEMLRSRGCSATVVSEPGILLGGFRISSAGRLIDETLDEKLRQKRALFVETSGFIID